MSELLDGLSIIRGDPDATFPPSYHSIDESCKKSANPTLTLKLSPSLDMHLFFDMRPQLEYCVALLSPRD